MSDSGHEADPPGSPRRSVLAAFGTGIAALAGCSGGGTDADPPDPITLTTDHACDVCGMIIPTHPGPSAELYYADADPAGHENPARFDSTWEAFQFDFERSDWERTAFYVTDYAAVDYEVRTDDGQRLISTHPAAEAFVAADSVTFVAGSEVVGAMGRDLIGFSDADAAAAFRDQYGGSLVELDEVSRELVASLGM